MKNPYGSNKSPKTIMDALETIKELFDKHGIFFWLEAGSLLGAVRDGRVIPGDDDGDISFWFKDFTKILKLKKEFKKRGYRLISPASKFEILDSESNTHQVCLFAAEIKGDYVIKVKFTHHLNWLLIWLFHKNIFCFDYLLWKLVYALKLYTDAWVRCPAYMLGDFATISYYGKDYRIPEYSVNYLAFKYGDDWRTPRANYKGFKYRLKELL